MISNSKGNAILDTLFFLIFMVVLLISGLFLVKVLNPVVTDFQNSNQLGATAKTALDGASHMATIEDNIVLICLIFLWITALVASYLIDSHPLFFIIVVVILLLFTLASGLIGKMLYSLFNDGALIDTAAQMPISNFIANHLFLLVLAMGFSVMLVMFAKGRQPQ